MTALRSVDRLAACFSERSFSAAFFAVAFSASALAVAFFAEASLAAFSFAAFSAASFAVGMPAAATGSTETEDRVAVVCASLGPPVAVMAVTEPAATSTAVAILCERVMRRVEMRGMRELFLWGRASRPSRRVGGYRVVRAAVASGRSTRARTRCLPESMVSGHRHRKQ